MKMIYQMYHQNKSDKNNKIFCSQREIRNGKEFTKWVKDLKRLFPPPEGFKWRCINGSMLQALKVKDGKEDKNT